MKLNLNKPEKIAVCVSFALLLISSLLFSGVIKIDSSKNSFVDELLSSSNIKVNLNIDVYDSNGNLKSSKLKENDLVLNNFGELWKTLLTDIDANVGGVNFVRDDGVGATLITRYAEIYGFWEGLSGTDGAFIGIGTGTTTPEVTDYALEAEVETRSEVGDAVYSNGNVTISASISCTGTANIAEASLFLQEGFNNYNFMMLHDVFGAVGVVDGDTIVITYTIMLSVEFTDNFGKILAGVLSSITDGEATKTYSLTDVDGNSITVNYASGASTEPVDWVFDHTAMGTPLVGIGIGNGTTSPARDDYNIETQVENINGVHEPTYDGGNISISTVHVTTGSRAITEAGLFIFVRSSAGVSEQVLLWHDTFTVENIGDGEAVTTTLEMSAN